MRTLASERPVPRGSLVAAVVERIRGYIEREALKTGDRIPGELDWCRTLEVSRPVIREAIGRLQSLGLVTVARGRGHGVTVGSQDAILSGAQSIRAAIATSPRSVQQVQEFRIALESHAARLAAVRITDELLAELNTLAAGIARSGMNREEQVQADFRFHRRIVEIADNALILNVLLVSQELVADGIRNNWNRSRGKKINTRASHHRIISALRSRDPDTAQRAILAHIAENVLLDERRRTSARRSSMRV